jgi:radical SAM protein with 4Fe4S-binding SPASM domain
MSPAVYSLRHAVWELTLACCFSCRHCGSSGGKPRADELSTAECLRLAGELAELGCERVSLIGGEVFMRGDWAAVAGRLTDLGIRVNIITNGWLFDRALLDELRSVRPESVSVSLDGPRELHDARRCPGSFDRALVCADALIREGIPVSFITTLDSGSAAELDSLYETVRSYPVYAWQIQACSPMGNAAASGVDVAFDFRAVMEKAAYFDAMSPFAVGVADNIGYFIRGDGALRGAPGGVPFPGCSAGITGIGIDSAGNIRGCESMYDDRFIEGNVRERSLSEIWSSPGAFAYNRGFDPSMLTGPCAECPYGLRCRGGCRSYNYFTHGRLYESPRCARAAGLTRTADKG